MDGCVEALHNLSKSIIEMALHSRSCWSPCHAMSGAVAVAVAVIPGCPKRKVYYLYSHAVVVRRPADSKPATRHNHLTAITAGGRAGRASASTISPPQSSPMLIHAIARQWSTQVVGHRFFIAYVISISICYNFKQYKSNVMHKGGNYFR